MLRVCSLVVVFCSVASAWAPLGRAQAPARTSRVAMAAKEEPKTSRSKEVLDSAKAEEEAIFEAQAAEAAALARSTDAVAQQHAAADEALAALRAARPEVAAVLESRGSSPTGKLAKALRKPSGTMALIGEGVSFDSVSFGGYDLCDPSYLGEQFRTGGCVAVCVSTSGVASGLGDDALPKTVAEQETARGGFPSPLPAISRALVVDELQLAEAKADGAVGVTLLLSLNGKEKTAALMAASAELGLEALVRVCDAEQLATAQELGAGIIVIGDCTLADATALRETLPSGKAGPVSVADIAFHDVRGAWKIRDAGFNAMIASKSLLSVCVRDRVPPSAICKAILSKGSVKYGLGMQKGRLEGSKEFLGSMAM